MSVKNNKQKIPTLIKGNISRDSRGEIFHVNDFDLTQIKRIYIIENKDSNFYRGWKGHLVEKRWFLCTKGAIKIYLAKINELDNKINNAISFHLHQDEIDILFVPPGYATIIKQIKPNSRIMAFSDYYLGESNDENLRWPNNIISL